MAILSLDNYIAATKQNVQFRKTVSQTAVAYQFQSFLAGAGLPGAGTLTIGNTANGLVPTDATAGCPTINNFGAGQTGYLTRVEFTNTVASRMRLYDRVFHAGSYAFNANVILAAQPSYAARIPMQNGVADYTGCEIWIECNGAHTGILSVNIGYNDQNGAAQTTGVISVGVAMIAGKMFQMPLLAGTTGVSQINSVVATVATVGTFNIVVARPLWEGRVQVPNFCDTHELDRTGMPQVFDTSAIQLVVAPDSTASGVPGAIFEVASA